MNFGFRSGLFIFSRSRAMCAMTVLLLFCRYFSFHTASNSSSDGTTRPCREQRYQRIENSIGVSASSRPKSVHLWLSRLMMRPRMSYSAASSGAAALWL